MSRSLAVVTGGASGLGKIIAWSLHRQGWHVAIADRDQDAGVAVADELINAAGQGTFIRVDISDENEVRRLFEQVAALGHLRLLVNNAGGWLPGAQFPDTDDWHRSLDLNLRMPMLATQLALPLMHDGGAVINISSSAGWDSAAYSSPEYAVAKAGLIRFTTAVADFADRFGVRVGCVVPHWIGLPRAAAEFDQIDAEARARSGGLIDPKVVVDAVLELADDPNSAGRIVIVRAGRRPYAIDPAASDPLIDIAARDARPSLDPGRPSLP
jgi:3-oxoacyl-[acyl-carrier protein] reductase